MATSLSQQIIDAFPELVDSDLFNVGIHLQDDSDGSGAYIKEWNYSKPIPATLKPLLRS